MKPCWCGRKHKDPPHEIWRRQLPRMIECMNCDGFGGKWKTEKKMELSMSIKYTPCNLCAQTIISPVPFSELIND